MSTLPTEFSFNMREWHRLLLLVFAVCGIGGLLAGVIGGHPWTDTIRFTVALPVIATSLVWLTGCYSTHRSYVIMPDGVILRRRGRDIEHIAWADITEVRRWPLAIVLRSGRKISFHLMRSDMQRARDILVNVFPNT